MPTGLNLPFHNAGYLELPAHLFDDKHRGAGDGVDRKRRKKPRDRSAQKHSYEHARIGYAYAGGKQIHYLGYAHACLDFGDVG